MTTNLSPKDISEIKENRSETAWNWFNIFNTGILLIIAILNVVINININNVSQKLDEAEFLETTIDNLAGNINNREIALSILYSIYILESKKPIHKPLLIDISETILEVILDSLSNNSNNNSNIVITIPQEKASISKKALRILADLDPERFAIWNQRLAIFQEKSPAQPFAQKSIDLIDLSILQKNNALISDLLNASEQAKDKKGLVFIQYNDESKKDIIDLFRTQQLQEWNAPGIEFIKNYNSPSDKFGDIRFFHNNEKELVQELQTIFNKQYCPQQQAGCFEIKDLSEKYPNLPEKQFEVWIDAKKITQ